MEKIKIAFIDIVGLQFNGDTLKERGLGGSEAALIYLSQELSKINFDVTIYNNCDREGIYDGIRYIHKDKMYQNDIDYDVVIAQRSCLPFAPLDLRDQILKEWNYDIYLAYPVVENAKFKAVWLHDTFCNGDNYLEYFAVNNLFDEIFTLSDWHTNYICNGHSWRGRVYEVLKKKIWQTRNGLFSYIDEVDYKEKDPNQFIFTSAVSKGLPSLLDDCWSKIKAEIPDAKLQVLGGYYKNAGPNNTADKQEIYWRELKNKYDGKDGIEFTGILSPPEVAEKVAHASLMVYPALAPETFSISVLEAINYNTPIVTCRFAALEETAAEQCSYLIDYEMTRVHGQVDRFVNMVKKAYKDNYLRQQKSFACNEFKPWITWDTVALQWKQHFYNVLGLRLETKELEKVREINRKITKLFNRRFLNKEDIFDNYTLDNTQRFINVVTPVWNAENYISKCIESVANQLYDNYNMVIIDDMSTDNTWKTAVECVKSLPKETRNKFMLIKNDEKKYAVGNQFEYIKNHISNPDDIIILLDGDDWLANDPDIFSFINREYLNGAEFTYGSCHSVCDNIDLIAQPYPKKVLEEKNYRKYLFNWGMPYTHLRTFSKLLFDLVDESVFFDENGDYFKAGGDNCMFYPLIEKCQPNQIHCIQRILYNYNDTNPLNDYKINSEEQNKTANYIRIKGEK